MSSVSTTGAPAYVFPTKPPQSIALAELVQSDSATTTLGKLTLLQCTRMIIPHDHDPPKSFL